MQFNGDLGYLRGLGQGYGAAIGAATSLIGAATAKKKPASAPSMAKPPTAGSTTVSPVIQTKISPQISPVFTQIQDSPYATASGAPSMVSTGAQTAETGMPDPNIPPSLRRRAYAPYDEYGRSTGSTPYSYYPQPSVVTQQGGGYQELIKWGLIGGIALFAINSLKKPRGAPIGGKTYTTKNYKRLN